MAAGASHRSVLESATAAAAHRSLLGERRCGRTSLASMSL
eukprot:CAMPEP_0174730426 /NCGR_PEP_ID=MMETSP1094-20130205/55580_1 /TAXON_ID=156173 /ORGANISM="Chrysochromulina brevifilum, Strain UTEX LB 985" /LENGTH=39 /DNA_ID= /DNA_START= /DNA_END= /DNA_ORIENTATION=